MTEAVAFGVVKAKTAVREERIIRFICVPWASQRCEVSETSIDARMLDRTCTRRYWLNV